jgi:hypothetical protein
MNYSIFDVLLVGARRWRALPSSVRSDTSVAQGVSPGIQIPKSKSPVGATRHKYHA